MYRRFCRWGWCHLYLHRRVQNGLWSRGGRILQWSLNLSLYTTTKLSQPASSKRKACVVLLNKYGKIQKTNIYTDSQATLLTLLTPLINSSVVNKCRKALSSLEGQLHVSIILISDHTNMFGNSKADELTQLVASSAEYEVKLIP